MKAKPSTKEQLVYFLLQHISLGTYDKKFLTNIQSLYLIHKKPVTTNQSKLLDKIIGHYARQFRKLEIDVEELKTLPWTLTPIESLPEYTDAHCLVVDDIVEVRSPYKKEFIIDIKDVDFPLTWKKETKTWSAPFCEATVKHFINCLDKHYENVRYCDKILDIINTFADYEQAKYWNPTYTKVNGNLMIVATNKIVNEVTSHIEFNLKPDTLARISGAGVKIDQSVIDDASTMSDPKLIDFAISQNPIVDTSTISSLIEYLQAVGCDCVVLIDAYHNKRIISSEIKTLLTERNIPFFLIEKRSEALDVNLSPYNFPVLINTALWDNYKVEKYKVAKTIFLGNSSPINVK